MENKYARFTRRTPDTLWVFANALYFLRPVLLPSLPGFAGVDAHRTALNLGGFFFTSAELRMEEGGRRLFDAVAVTPSEGGGGRSSAQQRQQRYHLLLLLATLFMWICQNSVTQKPPILSLSLSRYIQRAQSHDTPSRSGSLRAVITLRATTLRHVGFFDAQKRKLNEERTRI